VTPQLDVIGYMVIDSGYVISYFRSHYTVLSLSIPLKVISYSNVPEYSFRLSSPRQSRDVFHVFLYIVINRCNSGLQPYNSSLGFQ
jgi:hypothetical protein